jgi:hypothetical protein
VSFIDGHLELGLAVESEVGWRVSYYTAGSGFSR